MADAKPLRDMSTEQGSSNVPGANNDNNPLDAQTHGKENGPDTTNRQKNSDTDENFYNRENKKSDTEM